MDYLQYCTLPFVSTFENLVLNLIINGLPSIQYHMNKLYLLLERFKPYYKWITFNTESIVDKSKFWSIKEVLNLIINGLPSIHNNCGRKLRSFNRCFKPYYKWITFNTSHQKYNPDYKI